MFTTCNKYFVCIPALKCISAFPAAIVPALLVPSLCMITEYKICSQKNKLNSVSQTVVNKVCMHSLDFKTIHVLKSSVE